MLKHFSDRRLLRITSTVLLLTLVAVFVGGPTYDYIRQKQAESLVVKHHLAQARDGFTAVTLDTQDEVTLMLGYLKHLRDLQSLAVIGVQLDESQLEEIGALRDLTRLDITNGDVSDNDLQFLSSLDALTHLYLQWNPIEGSGLVHLAELHSLAVLDLSATEVSGPGLEALAPLPKLNELYLGSTHLNDDGMDNVAKLPRLHRLDFGNTHVTEAGLFKLVNSYWLVQPNFPDDIVGAEDEGEQMMDLRRAMMRRFRDARLEALKKARGEGKMVPPDSHLPFTYIAGDE